MSSTIIKKALNEVALAKKSAVEAEEELSTVAPKEYAAWQNCLSRIEELKRVVYEKLKFVNNRKTLKGDLGVNAVWVSMGGYLTIKVEGLKLTYANFDMDIQRLYEDGSINQEARDYILETYGGITGRIERCRGGGYWQIR